MADAPDDTVELLHRWHGGERSALVRLLDKHLPQLLDFVRQSMRPELRALRREQDPMDLVQIAAAKVMSYVPPFVPEDGHQFQRLLRAFVRNEISNQLRTPSTARRSERQQGYGESVLDLRASTKSSLMPDRAAEKREHREMVQALARLALEFLEENDRRIVQLRKFEDLGWEDIGQELGMQPDAVRMRYHRALPRLANHIRQIKEREIEELLASTGV